jgi:hypothetical protein
MFVDSSKSKQVVTSISEEKGDLLPLWHFGEEVGRVIYSAHLGNKLSDL